MTLKAGDAKMWYLFQGVIIFSIMMSDVSWRLTKNGYVAALVACCIAFVLSFILKKVMTTVKGAGLLNSRGQEWSISGRVRKLWLGGSFVIPRVWLKNYIPAGIIGGLIGLAIGFAVHQLSGGAYNIIGFILEFHRGRDALFWILGGTFTAGAITFLCAPNAK